MLFVVLMLIVFVCLVGSAILEAWLEIRNRPKKQMLWCGECKSFFAEENAIQLFPELGDKIGNTKMCPICYYKKVFVDTEKGMYQ